MKKYVAFVILLFIYVPGFALHIAGGEMYYFYKGPGNLPNTDVYTVTLRLFRECNPVVPGGQSAAPMPGEVEIGIFTNTDETAGTLYTTRTVQRSEYDVISLKSPLTCIVNPPDICYQIGYFTFDVQLPANDYGYTISYQTCCRSYTILNVEFFNIPGQPTSGEGATYACQIPGKKILGDTEKNSSAVFDVKDTVLVCQQKKIKLDFSASDPDSENPLYGDSLSYSFCDAYNRGAAVNSSDVQPSNPPYQSVTYAGGYAGEIPLGENISIDPKTGIISGTIGAAGGYVVNVCVAEWRHGRVISVHRKDFLLRVAACDFAAADLNPTYITCDGFGLDFQNNSTSSAIKSYFWDFGDPNSATNTSTDPTPTHVYSDTGIYPVKLYINKGQQCSDSGTTLAEVYPGFKANFGIKGSCLQAPYQFIDSSVTKYGEINSWSWLLGDGATSDTSDPIHTYLAAGTPSIQLTVTNTKGCTETITKTVDIRSRPVINLGFSDTLICNSDTLQLSASANFQGSYTWSPDVNISNIHSRTPLIYPTDSVKYYISFDDGKGCANTDSVMINVVDSAFVHLGADTTICLGDTVQLKPQTNALYFTWQPAVLSGSTPQDENPYVRPLTTTTYSLTGKISKHCIESDDIVIREIPYPEANAGPDVTLCYGSSVKLSGSIAGSSFTWSPASSLYQANTLTPVAGPVETTTYTLTVYDTLTTPHCGKPAISYVTVKIVPPVTASAGNDTSVVVNQPVQLNASGGNIFTWQPSTGLNDPNIQNPIGIYPAGITSVTYKVRVQNSDNCVGYASVTVKIYQTGPEIFVPSAFSPNGDGTNDVLRAVVTGLKQFDYIRIFNRWGNMVYSSANASEAWDGNYNGEKQPPGTYVYEAQGIDYLGKTISRKGTLVLIR